MANTFDNVHIFSLSENGESTKDYQSASRIELASEQFSVIIRILNGRSMVDKLGLQKEVELAKIGESGVHVSNHGISKLIKFASPKDAISFTYKIKEMLSNRKDSVFNERTDAASAEQYFQFYGYLSQQQNMMQDYVRTSTYQRAMLDNTIDFLDKTVLDVGAGSGILSFFAVQAGARKVYAIEASSMAVQCETLVKNNKLTDKIEVIAGKIEEVDLPEQVDIIVSEPMGYMLFNERMLETYLHAKKWLKPGGKMFPSQGDLHVAPFTDDSLYMEQFSKANFWYQPSFHGVDLSSLREAAVKEYFKQPVVDTFDIRICLARSQKYTVDFQTAHETELHTIDVPVSFMMLQSGTVHGLAFWFDVAFIGSQSTVWLSTSPTEPLTHWYQVRCLLQVPIFVKQGQTLTGRVLLKANVRQSYDVELELNIPGTNTKSSSVLDLKNPFFRYTGQQPQAPPGSMTVSPSDAYWTQDALSQAQYNLGTIVNGGGMGDGTVILQQQPQQQQQGVVQQNLVPIGNAAVAPVNPGSIPAVTAVGSANNAANQAIQTRTSIGGGISPTYFMNTSQPQFSVSNQFMIGDYAIPNSQLNLPSQGLAQQNYKSGAM